MSDIEKLRREFLHNALQAYEARKNRSIDQQDLWDDRLQHVINALRRIGAEGVAVLRDLTSHEERHVRLFAAGGYAREDQSLAIKVLAELADSAKDLHPNYHADPPAFDPIPREARITKGWIERKFPVWLTGV